MELRSARHASVSEVLAEMVTEFTGVRLEEGRREEETTAILLVSRSGLTFSTGALEALRTTTFCEDLRFFTLPGLLLLSEEQLDSFRGRIGVCWMPVFCHSAKQEVMRE